MNKNSSFIDLSRLLLLTKKDEVKTQRYLRQFLDLIPENVVKLNASLIKEDRKKTREIVHHIGPQLVFFGVPETKEILELIEREIEFMPIEELKTIIHKLLFNIEKAVEEIRSILAQKTDQSPLQ